MSSKLLRRGNVSKSFKACSTEEEKDSGLFTENVDQKLVFFQERFDQIDVPENDCTRAFSIMLKGDAIKYYLSHQRK